MCAAYVITRRFVVNFSYEKTSTTAAVTMRRGVGGGEVPRRCTDADTIDGAGG